MNKLKEKVKRKMEKYTDILDKLLEKECFIIDFLPEAVHEDSEGQFWEIESYLLKAENHRQLREKLVRVILKIMCYYEMSILSDTWISRPSPELVERMVLEGLEDSSKIINFLFQKENVLVVLDGGALNLSVYNPSVEMQCLFEQIAMSEGLFWRASLTFPEWKVYFDGNFWGPSENEEEGKEIPIDKTFKWAGRHWVIPSVYMCEEGMVVDFCMQIEKEEICTYMKKWNLSRENDDCDSFLDEDQMKMELENPFSFDIDTRLQINGEEMETSHGCAVVYNSMDAPYGARDYEAEWIVNHYGLEPGKGWTIYRYCYPWKDMRVEISSITVKLMQRHIAIPGKCFKVCAAGDMFRFTYPEGGTEYTLMVREFQAQVLAQESLPFLEMEYPERYYRMKYSVTPELPEGAMFLRDCSESDNPRKKVQDFYGHHAAAVNVIGGADGPTAIFFAGREKEALTAHSSLHFALADTVEWRMFFREKQFTDLCVDLK